jgi:RHS repeat-associated protein
LERLSSPWLALSPASAYDKGFCFFSPRRLARAATCPSGPRKGVAKKRCQEPLFGPGYTTSTGNEQTAFPGWSYSYDHDANLITATQTSTGDYWTYSYDFRNRMTSAVEKDSSGTIIAQATFTYDALDSRIGTDENGTQTWTLFDGNTPVMDFNGSGSLTMRYLGGPTGILARQTAGGTVSWYLADRLGTVSDLVNDSGQIIDHVDFSAFGTVLDESNPSNGDRFMGFAGLERDTVTGLNLAVEREENPGTGRWDSQDPLGFGGGATNLYGYVGNGPTIATDPEGLRQGLGTGVRAGAHFEALEESRCTIRWLSSSSTPHKSSSICRVRREKGVRNRY